MDATASISSKLKRKATKAASSPDKNQLETSRKRMRVCHRPTFDISVRTAEIQKLCEKYHLAAEILEIETDFTDRLMSVDYGEKVTHVYNPVDYAYKPHIEFYRKFCKSSATVLLIGENPGPFGGAQTGVPFGDVTYVKEWLDIDMPVGSPDGQHSKRPVLGFNSTRNEGSGTRLWTFLKENFHTAEEFYDKCFIYNYCPLVFMNASGGNVTPSQMPATVKKELSALCDAALAQVISSFPKCELVVGIGRFAEERIKRVCDTQKLPHKQSYLLHPSPRNPAACKNWNKSARESFVDFGLLQTTDETG